MKICVPKPHISDKVVFVYFFIILGIIIFGFGLVLQHILLTLILIGLGVTNILIGLDFMDKFPFKFCNRWGIEK